MDRRLYGQGFAPSSICLIESWIRYPSLVCRCPASHTHSDRLRNWCLQMPALKSPRIHTLRRSNRSECLQLSVTFHEIWNRAGGEDDTGRDGACRDHDQRSESLGLRIEALTKSQTASGFLFHRKDNQSDFSSSVPLLVESGVSMQPDRFGTTGLSVGDHRPTATNGSVRRATMPDSTSELASARFSA